MGKYTDQKNKYFDIVISRYSNGALASEIVKEVPVGKSTVYRWVNEHLGKDDKDLPDGVVIPRTPASVAKTIKAMAIRIAELEKEVEELRKLQTQKRPTSISQSMFRYKDAVNSIISVLQDNKLI